MNILMLMTGSIACAKASGLISLWTKNGHNVTIVASQNALKFVGIATLEGLSGNSVVTSVFETDNMMEHINLSRKADIIILAPATANSINKLANGIADDMITTTWIAAQQLNKPMYVVPAMNTKMWEYPATQSSIAKLQSWDVTILSPKSGELACGEIGNGRMIEIEDIDKAVMKPNNQHILITAGGTREYIDGVRYIGNLSTGSTGATISDFFTNQGYNVTWIGANNAKQPKQPCNQIFYETFQELSNLLKENLKTKYFDVVIHAAAISDFSVDSVKINNVETKTNRQSKLPTSDSMCINLIKNPKLVNNIQQWSRNSEINVVAFKLTNTKDQNIRKDAVNKLFKQKHINFIAHNDLTEITKEQHPFILYESNEQNTVCKSTHQLCQALIEKTL